MIILRDIDTLRDGGSIVMKLWVTTTDLQKYDLKMDQGGYITVMVDYAANSTTPGAWYNGIKYADSKQITSKEFKDEVTKELEKKIEREQFYLHKLLNENTIITHKS